MLLCYAFNRRLKLRQILISFIELVRINDALANSWRDAVSQKVSCVLNRMNFTSPPLVLMTDLLYLYDKIIQGTRELFDSHSSLFLSVSDGYCIAFQGLNEVKSVKVGVFFWLVL